MADPTMPALPAARNPLEAQPDLLREFVEHTVNALLSADADALCGAPYGVARASARIAATATASGVGTPALVPSSCRSPSCARAATSRTGCSTGVDGPRRR